VARRLERPSAFRGSRRLGPDEAGLQQQPAVMTPQVEIAAVLLQDPKL